MLAHYESWLSVLALTCGLGVCADAATIYNEAVSGDLSNSGLTPTIITVAIGSNQVFGTTGRNTAGVVDRDYLTFTVPANLALTAVTPLPGTITAGPISFIGLEAGNQITLPTNTVTAAGLLGWWHYSTADINVNILNNMAVSAEGSSGFTPPLGSGSYAVWIQDFGAGTFNYGFDFALGSAAVPEPATSVSMLLGVAVIALAHRSRMVSRTVLQ